MAIVQTGRDIKNIQYKYNKILIQISKFTSLCEFTKSWISLSKLDWVSVEQKSKKPLADLKNQKGRDISFTEQSSSTQLMVQDVFN